MFNFCFLFLFLNRQREANRKKAKEFLIEGKLKEAREYYQRAVDITSEMALDLIKVIKRVTRVSDERLAVWLCLESFYDGG